MCKYLLSFIILFISLSVKAQNFEYGKATQAEMDMKVYDKDTSAHAVILNEYGKAEIGMSFDNNIRLTYEYHVKIKILDSRGFFSGTVVLPLFNNEDNTAGDEINNISGITSYKDDNGITQVAELDTKNIYKTKVNKFESTWKFAMPDVRAGCVIEYRYILISPFFDHLHSWAFQSILPKVHSAYEAKIPGFWNYNVALRGSLKLSKSKSDVQNDCFSAGNSKSGCLLLSYAMDDVPAFVFEEYMTSPKNYMAALNFDLIEFTNPYTGQKKKVTKEWKDVDNILKDNPEFGSLLKKKNVVKDHVPPAILTINDTTERAKAIYRWAQSWFKWNNFNGIYSHDGLKKAIEAHTGSDAEINLTLVNALNIAGITAEAVLLSTREHGLVNKLYPVIGDFNYVVARVPIGGKSYFLDATDPVLPFGMLQIKCLNDQGRAFSLDKPSYWVDMDTKQRKISTITLDLTLQDDGKLKGKLNHYTQGFDAYVRRKEIKKFNSIDEYIESLEGRWRHIKVLKSNITNIDSLDAPINEDLDIEIDTRNSFVKDHYGFNPYFFDKRDVNPFKLTNRNYPVDMGMPYEERYVLVLHMPDKYGIESAPKNQSLSLADNDAFFAIKFDENNNTYTFSSLIKVNNTIYPAGEYTSLKEFFNKVILAEKENLLFKKKQ
ncbi:MAG TPA: DUF3857 domain-containing protein [Mucilaginibacter sp.]